MTCYSSGFGDMLDGQHPIWIGDFNGGGRAEVLFHYAGDGTWWLGSHNGTQFDWSLVSNTAGFGDMLDGQHPIWIGNFSRTDRAEVLFHYAGDGTWWLGSHNGTQFDWSLVSNTAGFGDMLDGQHQIWIGNFSRTDRTEVLFHYTGDGTWWLGSHNGTQFDWSLVSNTAGFGNLLDGQHPIWIGDFNGGGRAEVLFHYAGDGTWWLGSHNGTQFDWSLVGNTAGFGDMLDGQHPIWIGDFNGGGRAEVLFHYTGDGTWWLGSHNGTQFDWSLVSNTAGFGNLLDGQHPIWIGDFNGGGQAEVLFHYAGDGTWWLGSHNGTQLDWSLVSNTAGFGNLLDGQHPIWIGNFSRTDRAEVLFHYAGDGTWWLGSHNGTQFDWSLVSNTGRPCRESVVVHFKSLLPITRAINTFFDNQFMAMEQLFSEGGIAVFRGPTEDLSGNTALAGLLSLDVGGCFLGMPTAEHNTLFANRNNVGANDLVVYLVQSLVNGTAATNFLGCATHPNGQPGAAVVQVNVRWLVAHEVGHVLGLQHVASTISTNSDFLMWPNVGWTNTPPDISQSEYATMFDSALTNQC